jgi:hypothetical protein
MSRDLNRSVTISLAGGRSKYDKEVEADQEFTVTVNMTERRAHRAASSATYFYLLFDKKKIPRMSSST